MAQPTNTFDSYDAVGIREDLQTLSMISLLKRLPFILLARK
jgi:hypothetical protein